MNVDIIYIHGEIIIDPRFKFTDELRTREMTYGDEFLDNNGKILFGKTYEDKKFLNSILNNNYLEHVPIGEKEISNIDKESIVDFVGYL